MEDPFRRHMADPDESNLAEQIKNIRAAKIKTVKVATSSDLSCSFTAPEGLAIDLNMFKSLPRTILELEVRSNLH